VLEGLTVARELRKGSGGLCESSGRLWKYVIFALFCRRSLSLLNRGSCGGRRQQREERSLQRLEILQCKKFLRRFEDA
jgi:hypothetical protein